MKNVKVIAKSNVEFILLVFVLNIKDIQSFVSMKAGHFHVYVVARFMNHLNRVVKFVLY